MTYEVFAVEVNLASQMTTVRFRVWETLGELHRVVDECKITLEGRYDLDDEGLEDALQAAYLSEVANA